VDRRILHGAFIGHLRLSIADAQSKIPVDILGGPNTMRLRSVMKELDEQCERPMPSPSRLLRAVLRTHQPQIRGLPSHSDALADIGALLAGFQLELIRRYFHQVHWEAESREAAFADRVEPGLKLENVAAHSWHVADAALLIAPHFPQLKREKVLSLAILHDKLEIYTGDFDPVGPDGRGTYSHAFHSQSQQSKILQEEAALELYIASLRESVRSQQREEILDIIHGYSPESMFVRAIDKLQALAYVCEKKKGDMSNAHLVFSIRYSRLAIEYFPGIQCHYAVLLECLIDSVAAFRKTTRAELERALFSQLELDLRSSK
jgi:5'-deoxynucleotidase YfbR-like HD superfamily hydrolase